MFLSIYSFEIRKEMIHMTKKTYYYAYEIDKVGFYWMKAKNNFEWIIVGVILQYYGNLSLAIDLRLRLFTFIFQNLQTNDRSHQR